METPLSTFIERVSNTLEHVVAPEIKSPIVRGQLFAVIELLNQLPGRFEYRHDYLVQDITSGKEILRTILDALRDGGIGIPEEISAAAADRDLLGADGQALREEREQVEVAVSSALDLLNTHRASLPNAAGVEKTILERLQQGLFRDLMLFRPHRFGRISRADKEDGR